MTISIDMRCLVYTSLFLMPHLVASAQDMNMDAKAFNNKSISDHSFRSSYENATGEQYVAFRSESESSYLILSYDIVVERGETLLTLKYGEKQVWHKRIEGDDKQNKLTIDLIDKGDYQLVINLKDASGKHRIKWNVVP